MISISIIILAAIIMVTTIAMMRRKTGFSKHDQKFFHEKWVIITALVDHSPAQSVLEADKLLDLALHKLGFQGSFGEKLKRVGKVYFSHEQQVWDAHKLRNQIAHEVGFQVSRERAQGAISIFKQALRDLGLTV